MRSTSGLGFDSDTSDGSEVEGMEDKIFHGVYRRQRSVRGREDAKVQKEVGEAGRKSLDEGDEDGGMLL